MDEFHFSRNLRRLALLAAINCAALTSSPSLLLADEGTSVPNQSSLRSLLQEGWQEPTTPPKKVITQRKLTPITVTVAKPISTFKKVEPKKLGPAGRSVLELETSTPSPLPSNTFVFPPNTVAPGPQVQASVKPSVKPGPPDTTSSVYGESFGDLKREALRTIARDSGFNLFTVGTSATRTKPTESQLPKPRSVLQQPITATERAAISQSASSPAPSALMAQMHTNKLRQVAQGQLRDANDRFRRGATHSARHLAIKALQNIVAMRDMATGGNRHAAELEQAFTAMQEAGDFGGKFGAVNQQSLKRLVAVHTTRVLKDHDLTRISPLQAMDMYLTASHDQLVAATGDARAASDALVLLGHIEQSKTGPDAAHSGAVAVMLQSAAVTSDPDNAVAQYALGSNLLKQGLAKQAARALQRGVQLSPSREGYTKLLTAASQLRDEQMVDQCQIALRSPSLRSTSPVRRLSPSDFASTYKPSMQERTLNSVTKQHDKVDVAERNPQIEAKPVSTTKRFFRSWMPPKFR